MKKNYEKPEIMFDSFELSQNIAAGCAAIANYGENQCSVTYSEGGIELNLYNIQGVCYYTGPGFEDMICYHAPGDWNNVFTS